MYNRKRNRYGHSAILLISVLLGKTGIAQEYSFINYEVKDGVAASVVYAAAQDKEGFMWFATENGLSRFNGKYFKNFSTADGLPDNDIINIFADSRGRVWAMPFKPQIAYYYHGQIHNSSNDSVLRKFDISAFIIDIAEDREGNLIFIENEAIHILHNDNSVQTIRKINAVPFYAYRTGKDNAGNCAAIISSNQFYFPVTGKLQTCCDPTIDQFEKLFAGPWLLMYEKKNKMNCLYRDNVLQWQQKAPDNIFMTTMPADSIIAYNGADGTVLVNIATGKTINHFLRGIPLNRVFFDKEGNYWFCSRGKGIYRLPSTLIKSKIFTAGAITPGVSSITKLDSEMIFGTDIDAIWKKDKTDNFINLSGNYTNQPDNRIIGFIPINNNETVIAGSQFIKIAAFRKNNIVVKSLPIYDGLKSCIKTDNGILASTSLRTILYSWPLMPGNESVIFRGRSTCAVEKDGGYYIGTLKGLYFKPYKGDSVSLGLKYPVLHNRTTSLAIADDGTLWISSIGGGVVAWKNKTITNIFNEENGLSSNNVLSLFPEKTTIWAGTEKGLSRINISQAKGQVTRYSVNDGLCSDIINALYVDDNIVYAGTPKGLSYFNPDEISQHSICDLQVNGIYVSGKYWAYDSTGFSLKHKNNDIRFEFSGISFKSAGEITYQYRLLGLNDEWRTTTENTLAFPSLPSGKYTFQLVAVNKYDVKSKTVEIAFTINEMFWEKPVVWFLLLALVAALLWIFIRYRLKKINTKQEEKYLLNQQITELKYESLRSQMNPHFIFNSLNSIQQYVAERDTAGANKFITGFARLIRMTLDYSSKPTIKLSEEINYIETYLELEKTRLEGKFDYHISIDDNIDTTTYQVPTLLLQPFAENCIRHGIKYRADNKGMIQFKIKQHALGLLLSIEDNGVGRAMANRYKSDHHVQYQSKGTLLSAGRIDILNSHGGKKIDLEIIDLADKDGKASGTRVDIILLDYENPA